VTGPVAAAAELSYTGHAVRLYADVAFPAGHRRVSIKVTAGELAKATSA
jgi:hypothetical protein